VAGGADLAGDDDVDRHPEPRRDGRRHRHPTPGQGEHDRVGEPERGHGLGEHPAGVGAVAEPHAGRYPYRCVVELHLFEQVADGLHGLLPDDLGPWRQRNHRWGLKLWFGPGDRPGREHYEAQVVGARHVPGATTLALEVGFHCEHPDPAANAAAIERLGTRWRRTLGGDVVAGPFLGHDGGWQRVSETWPDPDLGDPDLPLELAARLTDFAIVLEPLRRRTMPG
jgi:hypothetical protein